MGVGVRSKIRNIWSAARPRILSRQEEMNLLRKKPWPFLMSDPACKLSASLFEPAGKLWGNPRIVSYISICLHLSFLWLWLWFLLWCRNERFFKSSKSSITIGFFGCGVILHHNFYSWFNKWKWLNKSKTKSGWLFAFRFSDGIRFISDPPAWSAARWSLMRLSLSCLPWF